MFELCTFRYVGNLDGSRVTEQMMIDIFKNGLPHLREKVLSAKMFHPQDVCIILSFCMYFQSICN